MPLQPIGILVNDGLYRRIPTGRTKHEMLAFYEEAAAYYDMYPCYFRLRDIRPATGNVLAFVSKGLQKGYQRIWMPLPKVIHNRAIYRATAQKRLNRLASTSHTIYNLCNRYGKLHIYNLLMRNENLRPHLPGTINANLSTLHQYMEQYDSLIIKPDSGSIGKGIYKLDKGKDAWILTHKVKKRYVTTTFKKKIPLFLQKKIKQRNYVIQQRLPLATWDSRPFDLRVSVQRNITGDWQITGIVGKAARKNGFLTNVAQGGIVQPFSTLLQQYPELDPIAVEEGIHHFALTAARVLSMELPNLADLGMDIGITEHGFPLFIESNGRDQRYSFREANMMSEWKATYANPISYGSFLANR